MTPQTLVGIDLGTTNSALAWSRPRTPIRIFKIPQLSAQGELARFPTLPSFLYFPTDAERQAGVATLPWTESPESVAGVFAREHGALVPGRQVSSAKSWLANPAVDRTAALLPWGFDDGPRLSPVEASARLLMHLRDAWNHEHKADGELRLEDQPIVLTIPASFDEEARELTAEAARTAGLANLTLLEEPIAALYAWIAANRSRIAERLHDGSLVLVCDVGGGTTDFSLIRADAEGGILRFERVAIGEHLLLGGDNLDLALATLAEHKLMESGASTLTLGQRQTLRRKCSSAKEQLLSDASIERVRVTILGAGRGVVAGGMSSDLTREEAAGALLDGFLPIVAAIDLPARDRRIGLRELGLPYESEPAITKHLAAFLARAGRQAGVGMAKPDAVLFNGGFFTPAIARERMLAALASWFGARPSVLENERPEAAVAIGAAFYAKLRQNPSAAARLLIRAGTARSYYIGLQRTGDVGGTPAVCVIPKNTQEGSSFTLDREFSVTTNQPAAFTLYSSIDRTGALNEVVTFSDESDVHRHAPLVTVLRYGKRSRRVPLRVRLRSAFTEIGTLELWCESRVSDHRWRLAFNLRGTEGDAPGEETPDDSAAAAPDQAVIPDDALAAASDLLRREFDPAADPPIPPEALTGELESVLGFGKQAWTLPAIRRLADVLLAVMEGRKKGPAFEVRWLNLTGFCVRPGFGTPLDAWRVSELRKVYAAGLTFAKEIQCQVEWLVLWQRVSAGFTSGQQRELAHRVSGQLGIGQRKAPRINPQIEREAWRLLANLERLDANLRAKLGEELMDWLRRDPRNTAWLWAIGRFGARTPFYGPLSSVLPPATAERWIERLLAKGASENTASAIAQLGARTGDAARDISEDVRRTTIDRLRGAGIPAETLQPLEEITAADRVNTTRLFGETLPEGLTIEQ